MYDNPPPVRRNWPAMIVVLAILGFIVLAVWWMEDRFGAQFAMAVVGSLIGATLISWGVLMNQKNTQVTLNSAASFNRDLAMTEKARQGTYRIGAQMERDAFNQRARLELIDAKRVDKLAQQRAQLLRLPGNTPPEQVASWLVDDEDADEQPADARWYQ